MNINDYKAQCENEVKEMAKFRPILCPVFRVMNENVSDCFESMSVSSFVSMCMNIADGEA